MQTCFSAVGDLYLFKLSSKLAGSHVAQWTLLCQCLSWFTFYCATRTLTNTAETVLITIGLYYYPWTKAAALWVIMPSYINTEYFTYYFTTTCSCSHLFDALYSNHLPATIVSCSECIKFLMQLGFFEFSPNWMPIRKPQQSVDGHRTYWTPCAKVQKSLWLYNNKAKYPF